MQKADEYLDHMVHLIMEVREKINNSMDEDEKVEFENMYLGEKSFALGGYPQLYSIEKKDGKLILHGQNNPHLDKYNLGELLCILKEVEK